MYTVSGCKQASKHYTCMCFMQSGWCGVSMTNYAMWICKHFKLWTIAQNTSQRRTNTDTCSEHYSKWNIKIEWYKPMHNKTLYLGGDDPLTVSVVHNYCGTPMAVCPSCRTNKYWISYFLDNYVLFLKFFFILYVLVFKLFLPISRVCDYHTSTSVHVVVEWPNDDISAPTAW